MKKMIARLLALVLVLSTLLSVAVGAAVAEQYVQTTSSCNLRTGPGLDYDSVGSVSSGKTFVYSSEKKDSRGVYWYKVKYNKNGYKYVWISSKYSTIKQKAASGNTVYCVGKCNIRSSASLDGRKVGTFNDGDTAKLLDKKTDSRGVLWYKINFDGTVGWVSSAYTTTKKGGSGNKNAQTVTGSNKVYATDGDSNIRRKPDKSADKIGTFPQGARASYLGSKKDSRGVTWYKIKYDGITGWVSSKYTTLKK